jgi:hypothetical protein
MDPGVVGVFIPVVAIIAVAAVKIARIFASRPQAPTGDVAGRLESLEREVDALQLQLTETQERLDFAERLLTQAREERRLGG